MKIALIGNMNNNNFAIMRYLRDLGEDAHLFLWANDGIDSLSHFRPEFDCVDIEKWIPYIHQTNLVNGFSSIIPDVKRLTLPPSVRYIRELFFGFDVYIGSGLSPAILDRAGIKLDIFYPYGSGIEFVGLGVDRTLLAGKISLRKTVFKIIRKKQIESIKKARYCFNAELGLTAETFKEIGKKFLPLPIPIVYNREKLDEFRPTDRINGFVQAMRKSRCSIFSHASQMWVRKESFSEFEWTRASKNNQWLIEGFANFTKMAKGSDGLLVLVDYGQDVSAAKALCLELDILDKVLWLPKLSRIEVMYLLSICDIGVGEFLVSPGSIWGGTGWEVLASGKPLLQTFNFSNEEFFNAFGHEPPPILDVKSSEDVSKHLFDWYREPEKYIKQGVESRNWFNANNGIGLAKEWLRLLALIWD